MPQAEYNTRRRAAKLLSPDTTIVLPGMSGCARMHFLTVYRGDIALFPLRVDAEIELRLLTTADAELLWSLLEQNRAHLDAWLRWSGYVRSLEDTRAYIRRFEDKYAAGDGYHALLWFNGQAVGGTVCHFINRESHKTEIGYWLIQSATGKGLVTRTCRAVINHLIQHEHMHRIEIQCVVDNLPSRGVAERLGFTLEGIKRESDWITSAYRDHAMYALLEHEWRA